MCVKKSILSVVFTPLLMEYVCMIFNEDNVMRVKKNSNSIIRISVQELKQRREEKAPCTSMASETQSSSDNKRIKQIDIPDRLNDRLLSASKIGSSQAAALSRISSFDSVITDTNADTHMDPNITPTRNNVKNKNDVKPVEINMSILIETKNEHLQYKNDDENDKREIPKRKKSIVRFKSNEETDNSSQDNTPKKHQRPESSIGAFPANLNSEYSNKKNKDEEHFNFQNFSLKKYLYTEMLGIRESGTLLPEAVGKYICKCIFLFISVCAYIYM
jgi:hypothetical protein